MVIWVSLFFFLKYLINIFFIYLYPFRGKKIRYIWRLRVPLCSVWNYRSQWWMMSLYNKFAFHLNITFQFQFFAVFSHGNMQNHMIWCVCIVCSVGRHWCLFCEITKENMNIKRTGRSKLHTLGLLQENFNKFVQSSYKIKNAKCHNVIE